MTLDPSIKAVGFDMDGTILYTKVNYKKLANVVVDEFLSRGAPADIFKGVHYKIDLDAGYKWMIENGRFADKEEIKACISERATEIEIENVEVARPVEGVPNIFRRIHALGLKTGILTRGGRKYATTAMGMYDLIKEFDGIVARDDFDEETDAKPAAISMKHLGDAMGGIDPKNILYLGDGIVDYMTAVRAGSQFIAVTTGRTSRDEWKIQVANFLSEEPHEGYSVDNLVIFDTVEELNNIL